MKDHKISKGRKLQAGAILLLLVLVIGIVFAGVKLYELKERKNEAAGTVSQNGQGQAAGEESRLNFWYTDENLTDYLNVICNDYFEETGVRVVPLLKSGVDFLPQVADAGEDTDLPDLYELSNSSLQEADILGIAGEIPEGAGVNTDNYPQVTLRAMTCNDRILAFPLYYETAFLVGNKTYLENSSQEYSDYTPSDFTQLEDFADVFDAPEGVKAVLGWDTSDVFFNYFILGSSIDIAGENGDDENTLEIVNDNSIKGMEAYRELTQFFSLEEEGVTYSSIRDDFCKGEYVFIIASPDILQALDKAKASGEFNWEYEIYSLPDVAEGIASSPLSMTQCVAINRNSQNSDAAIEFAKYMTSADRAGLLYDMAGKLSPNKAAVTVHEGADKILSEYEKSISAPKLLARSDYWMRLEIAFMQVQNGTEADKAMKELEKSLK